MPLPSSHISSTKAQISGQEALFISSHRFTFNGKEVDNEVSGIGNSYDYGFRIYNPRLGKFLSVDPLTKEYPFYTPYQFAGNKPIYAVDLDGLEECPNEVYEAGKRAGRSLVNKIISYYIEKISNAFFDKATEKVEEKLEEKTRSTDHKGQIVGMTGEFLLGLGDEKRTFGPNEPITQSLKESNLTVAAVGAFWTGYKEYKEGKRPSAPSYYVAEFGYPFIDDSGPLNESPTNAAQFVGTATYLFNFDEKNGILNVTVLDDKNEWSLKYHQGNRDQVNHERGEYGKSGIMSNTYQTYIMQFTTEEIKQAVE